MHFTKSQELKKIVAQHTEHIERMSQPTAEGVKAIAECLGITTVEDYFDAAADIMLAIDAADGKRPGINKAAAKALFEGKK
jgi:hypothetical protein